MSIPARRAASYQDVLSAPDHMIAEVLGGNLLLGPRPAFAHAHAASMLAADLIHPFSKGRGGPGGWHILVEPELHLGADILVPDLAGWRRERFTLEPVAYSEQAPDWVCEIVSPSTARIDRVLKLPVYLRECVQYAWLIDPVARTLEVLRATDKAWLLEATYGAEDVVRAAPFDAIELELAALWIGKDPPRNE